MRTIRKARLANNEKTIHSLPHRAVFNVVVVVVTAAVADDVAVVVAVAVDDDVPVVVAVAVDVVNVEEVTIVAVVNAVTVVVDVVVIISFYFIFCTKMCQSFMKQLSNDYIYEKITFVSHP